MKCKICVSQSEKFANAMVMQHYNVAYYKCLSCGFVQTEEPRWLDEAYSEAIKRSDIGIIQRNLRLAKIAASVITTFFDNSKRFLDFGGGYGLLVRIMRDSGFDFHRFDKHCVNLFAPDFEAALGDKGGYELVTAFEVFEHLVNPVQEIGEMLTFANSIFFTTELLPDCTPRPGEWDYFGLEHGQHISFYTLKSLRKIADIFSLNLYSDGKTRHLLTAHKFSPTIFRFVSLYKVAALLSPWCRRESLTEADRKLIAAKVCNNQREKA